MSFYHIARGIVIFLMRFGFKMTIVHEEPIPKDKGIILACNHRSNCDPVFLGIGVKRQVRFMAKEELFHNKLFGGLLRRLGAFPVARGKGDHEAVDKAISIVQDGGVLGIFPEGGRSNDGALKRAKSGVILIASQAGGDVVPVGIRYGKRKLWRRCVTITYGKAIPNAEIKIEGHDRAQLKAAAELVMNRIAQAMGYASAEETRTGKEFA